MSVVASYLLMYILSNSKAQKNWNPEKYEKPWKTRSLCFFHAFYEETLKGRNPPGFKKKTHILLPTLDSCYIDCGASDKYQWHLSEWWIHNAKWDCIHFYYCNLGVLLVLFMYLFKSDCELCNLVLTYLENTLFQEITLRFI